MEHGVLGLVAPRALLCVGCTFINTNTRLLADSDPLLVVVAVVSRDGHDDLQYIGKVSKGTG